MEWIEENDGDYIFGLPGNGTFDDVVAKTADNLGFPDAKSCQEKGRTHTSFTYQAGSWTRPRKVVARLECSLQPDAGETTSKGMRQEVDIRYVVTSLKGSAQHLYENVYCQRGQMENLIKLHKAQLASDRMSCHSATANQVRLALHTAAFWLMHGVRAAIPQTSPLATAEFATIRERLIKIRARVIEDIARIRVQLPTSCRGRARIGGTCPVVGGGEGGGWVTARRLGKKGVRPPGRTWCRSVRYLDRQPSQATIGVQSLRPRSSSP